MSKTTIYQKAWLKLSYKQEVYVPVVILERASQLRSLVVDEGVSMDRKLAYYVDDNALLPRNQEFSGNNLLEMKYVNLPEIKKFLAQRISNKDNQKYKYTKIGINTIVDLQPPIENDLPNNLNSQLTKFYHTQLQIFLSNKRQTQKSIIIISKNNSNPHCYIDPLLHLMSKNNQLWPHKIKIDKLGVILKKLLFNVSLQIKLGFLQNKLSIRQSRKVMFLHLKPFLPVQPSEGLIIPQQILNLGNSSKFSQMYKGPIPIQTQTPASQIQAVIDALLSLGFEVKQVHSLMKLLSLIMNFQRICVQKQIEGSEDSKYATFHLKSRLGQSKQNNLQNIKQIIQFPQDRIQNLMFFGQYDHVSEMSLKQRQKLIYLQELGNKQQLATFRVHILKYLLYQMFITQLCDTLNKKLYSQSPASQSGEDCKNKCFVVLSYGIADKPHANIQQKQRINSMFWINGRRQLENKMFNILKYNILASIIGVNYDNQKPSSKLRDDLQFSHAQNSNLSGPSSSQTKKQVGFISKKQVEYESLRSFANYPQSIQQLKKSIESNEQHKYEYKQAILVHKQLCLYKLYQQMSSYEILSEISMALFKNLYRKDVIQQIPYTFYEYLWPNYQESEIRKGVNFQSVSSVITNRQLIFEDPSFLNRIVDAIRKKKIFMQSQWFENQMKGSMEITLIEFASRYQYTQVCKQRMHRKYPKEIDRVSKMANKKNKINAATPFLDYDSTIESFMGKVQQFIKKQKPKQFSIVTINGFKKQESIIEILDKELIQKMELEVDNQLKAVRRIQRQFIVYKNRKLTNNIIYKIARERQLQRLMTRLYTRARCKIGIQNIVEYSEKKYRKEQQELKRLKKLQQELEKQQRRRKDEEERERARKLREQEMARKRLQQEKLQKLKKQQQQRQRSNKAKEQQQIRRQKPNQNLSSKQAQPSRNQNQDQISNKKNSQNPQENSAMPKQKQDYKQKQMLTKPNEEQMKKKKIQEQKQKQKLAKMNQEEKQKYRQNKIKEEQQMKKKEQQIKNSNANNHTNNTKPQQQNQNQVKQNKNNQVKQNMMKPNEKNISQPAESVNIKKQPLNHPNDSNNHPKEQKTVPSNEPIKNMNISQTNPTQNSQAQSKAEPQIKREQPSNNNSNGQICQTKPMFILQEPITSTNPKQEQLKKEQIQTNKQQQPKQNNKLQPNNKSERPHQNPTNDKQQSISNPNQQAKKNPTNNKLQQSNSKPNEETNKNPSESKIQSSPTPNEEQKKNLASSEAKYQVKVQPNVIGSQKQQRMGKKQQPKQQSNVHLLSAASGPKKNENQYIEKSQNIQQLTNEELLTIQDHPIISLQEWQKNFKLKSEKTQCPGKEVFTKYGSMTERLPGKPFQLPKPQPDEQILDTFMDDNYLQYVKQNLNCSDGEQFACMLINQKQQLAQPYFKDYPFKKYPTYFKQAFNAILKIGYEKNSSKSLNELLNVFAVPLYESYYAQLAQMKSMFDESAMIPSDHSSPHNILKDQVFLYFMKQITPLYPQNFPKKCHYGYLFGLSVFTRSFCPSPEFLYPFTQHIHSLYKKAIQGNKEEEHIGLIESIFENLLLFIQANEGFKRNFVRAFVAQKDKPQLIKNQTECAGYLHLRKTPFSQFEINKPAGKLKPQPPLLTIWLVNNESFTFPIRNQIVKSIKKKVLAEIGFLFRQQCFSLYFLQPDGSYTLINQKQKAANLFPLMQVYKQLGKRRPIYCRIANYFPFNLRDINSTRMMYLNMISDQITYPFTAQQYQFLAAQSLAYQDYQQVRIGNYLIFSNQIASKTHDTKPVQQKYKQVALEASKKICQFQYLKYMKSIGFLLMKCHSNLKDPNYMIGIKPIQITFYKDKIIIASIHMRRVRNVYLTDKKVVLELYYKGEKEEQERLRTLTLQFFKKTEQLFKCILFHLENRIKA